MPYKNPEDKKRNRKAYYAKTEGAQKAYFAKHYRDNKPAIAKRAKQHREDHPEWNLLSLAKTRAKKKGLEFAIVETDIIIPLTCPLLGIPLIRCSDKRGGTGMSGNVPTLDRIDNTKGYVRGNVWVISWRANHLKSNATLEELERLTSNLRAKMNSHSQDLDRDDQPY